MNDPINIASSPPSAACPRCGRPTEHVQIVDAPFLVCLFFYGAWGHERIVACPKCVQARLWQLFWLSLPLSNILLPIAWPLLLLDIRRSRRKTCEEVPIGFLDRPNPELPVPPAKPRGPAKAVRLLVVGIILAIVVVGGFLLLPRGIQPPHEGKTRDQSSSSSLERIILESLMARGSISIERKSEDSKKSEAAFAPIFNGKDLSGWKVDDKAMEHWEAKNGVLHYDGKGEAKDNSVRTEERFSNAEFTVDFQFPAKDGKPCEFIVGQVWRKGAGSGSGQNLHDGDEDLSTFSITPAGKWSYLGENGEASLNPAGEWNKLSGFMEEHAGKTMCVIILNAKKIGGGGHTEAARGNFLLILRPECEMDFTNISVREKK